MPGEVRITPLSLKAKPAQARTVHRLETRGWRGLCAQR